MTDILLRFELVKHRRRNKIYFGGAEHQLSYENGCGFIQKMADNFLLLDLEQFSLSFSLNKMKK